MRVEPKNLIVYLPDTRGVTMSRFGHGNMKIGRGVYTYSRLPGRPDRPALGSSGSSPIDNLRPPHEPEQAMSWKGTCPGSTPECERICYASRPVKELGPVSTMWLRNSKTSDAPEIPEDAKLLRLHISGDFDTVEYINGWIERITARPDVKVWAYTRSWRIPALMPALERLRALPNVQLFASMDRSNPALPPPSWRRAWITGKTSPEHRLVSHLRIFRDQRFDTKVKGKLVPGFSKHEMADRHLVTVDATPSYVCPEETGKKPDCESCRYCFEGKKHDVTFLEH